MATRKKGRTRTARKRTSAPPKGRKPTRGLPARGAGRAGAGLRVFVNRRGPESLRLRAAIPSLTVNDLDRSIKFYTEALGFVIKETWKNDKGERTGVMLLAGVCELGLSRDDWAKGRDRRKGEGFRLWFETAQDVDALARRVKAAGHRLTEEPRDQTWGGRSFSFDDVDGFHVTIHRDQ